MFYYCVKAKSPPVPFSVMFIAVIFTVCSPVLEYIQVLQFIEKMNKIKRLEGWINEASENVLCGVVCRRRVAVFNM